MLHAWMYSKKPKNCEKEGVFFKNKPLRFNHYLVLKISHASNSFFICGHNEHLKYARVQDFHSIWISYFPAKEIILTHYFQGCIGNCQT